VDYALLKRDSEPSIFISSPWVIGIGSSEFLVIHGWLIAWWAVYLSDVPLEHKCQNRDDAYGLSSLTPASRFPDVILSMNVFSVSPFKKNGCLPVKIMCIIMPNAHTSILFPYL
jgi:hypothetical protein